MGLSRLYTLSDVSHNNYHRAGAQSFYNDESIYVVESKVKSTKTYLVDLVLIVDILGQLIHHCHLGK